MIPEGKRPRDPNQLAAMIVGLSTGGIQPEITRGQAAGTRLGGLKGGKARADKLSPEQRKSIAQKAAAARWTKKTG